MFAKICLHATAGRAPRSPCAPRARPPDPDPAPRPAAAGGPAHRVGGGASDRRELGQRVVPPATARPLRARRGGAERGRAGAPWRATALSTSWPNVADTEELAEAAQAFERFVLARYLARLEWWLDRRRTEPVEWQEAASYGDTLLYLTVDELASLRDALQALAEPYLDRLTDPAARPEDARLVRLLQIAFPDDEA